MSLSRQSTKILILLTLLLIGCNERRGGYDPVGLSAAKRQAAPGPDFDILEANPYGLSGLGQLMYVVNGQVFYSCPILNRGNAMFVAVDSLMTDFLFIKTIRMEDEWTSSFFKTDYDVEGVCLNSVSCYYYGEDTLAPGYMDTYFNPANINGDGHYVLMVEVNHAGRFYELDNYPNQHFFSFTVTNGKAVFESYIVPPQWKNKLRLK